MSRRYATNRSDLRRYLLTRENTAFSGFGALAELDLEHPDLVYRSQLLQPLVAQVSFKVTHSVFGGAYREDQVATSLQVIGRQSACAGIQPAARFRCTA